jgi:uncharacterized protein (TIGR02452 family)
MNTLAMIFNETRQLSLTTYRQHTQQLIENTKEYGNHNLTKCYAKSTGHGKVTFAPIGSARAARIKAERYKNVAVLNFANPIFPGGAVTTGATAQEENLCRCSNLYESISQDGLNFYDSNSVTDDLNTDNIIYSPKTMFFRDDESYDLMEPVFIDVITCAAPCCCITDKQTALNIYTHRITNIVESAIDNDVECLVLGAWGCGVFMQDPVLMASAFVSVLNKYKSNFKEVTFAIRNNVGTTSRLNNSNFHIFLQTFLDNYHGVVHAKY